MDYLNFARPYDSTFAHNASGSLRIFALWSAAFEKCFVTRPECWSQGKMAPHGHTISVSDIWLVGHYYGLVVTTLGEVGLVVPRSVKTTYGNTIACTLILKCTGYWKNYSVREMVGSNTMFSNNVVRMNVVYLAESVLDNVGGYQSPFGSSFVEGALFGAIVLMD